MFGAAVIDSCARLKSDRWRLPGFLNKEFRNDTMKPVKESGLKRNVLVIHRRNFIATAAWLTTTPTATGATTAEVAALVRSGAPAAAEKLHPLRYDFGHVTFAAAVLGLVVTIRDAPFDKDLPALLEVLAAAFSLFAVDDDIVPVGAFLLGAVAIRKVLAGGDREICYWIAGGEVADFRVTTQVTDQNHLVHRHRTQPPEAKLILPRSRRKPTREKLFTAMLAARTWLSAPSRTLYTRIWCGGRGW